MRSHELTFVEEGMLLKFGFHYVITHLSSSIVFYSFIIIDFLLNRSFSVYKNTDYICIEVQDLVDMIIVFDCFFVDSY